MTTREKIIVGLMCLTIVYGANELIGGRKPKPAEPVPARPAMQDLRTFVADISRKLMDGKVTEQHRHLIRQATAGWMKDPYIVSTLPLKSKLAPETTEKQSARTQQRMEIMYTGFLDMDGVRIAIINGSEYTTGEALDTLGYYVKSISAKRVVLGRSDGLEMIELPLQETEAGPN